MHDLPELGLDCYIFDYSVLHFSYKSAVNNKAVMTD